MDFWPIFRFSTRHFLRQILKRFKKCEINTTNENGTRKFENKNRRKVVKYLFYFRVVSSRIFDSFSTFFFVKIFKLLTKIHIFLIFFFDVHICINNGLSLLFYMYRVYYSLKMVLLLRLHENSWIRNHVEQNLCDIIF